MSLLCKQMNLAVLPIWRTTRHEVIMAVKSGQEAVNVGNSRVEFPPSLSNRIKNPTQIGSLSKSSKKQISNFFDDF